MMVAVVGDGAVGLRGALSAKLMGAGRIIVMSRHESRQALARELGATDIVPERGDEVVARIKDLTNGTRNARKAMPYPVPAAEPFQTLRTIGSTNRGPNLS
jgi:alcohol dehydrogenase